MAAQSHGNGTNFDWPRKSCDIGTCDLSPDGNLEKYTKPMKSAISIIRKQILETSSQKINETSADINFKSLTLQKGFVILDLKIFYSHK